MENTFDRKIDIDQLRNREPHQRKEDALDCLAHPAVFHRRFANNGGRIDRVLAVRDAGEMKDRIEIFERVEPGVVTECAFAAELIEVHVAFQHNF